MMEKIFYNNEGWVCKRYPYNLPIENEENYLNVDDEIYSKTLISEEGKAWRVVNGKLEEQVYNQAEVDKSLIEKEIATLKQEISKIKEDVEQVELFGMERADYQEKKARCVEIIQSLRSLEKQK